MFCNECMDYNCKNANEDVDKEIKNHFDSIFKKLQNQISRKVEKWHIQDFKLIQLDDITLPTFPFFLLN